MPAFSYQALDAAAGLRELGEVPLPGDVGRAHADGSPAPGAPSTIGSAAAEPGKPTHGSSVAQRPADFLNVGESRPPSGARICRGPGVGASALGAKMASTGEPTTTGPSWG